MFNNNYTIVTNKKSTIYVKIETTNEYKSTNIIKLVMNFKKR